MLVIPVEQSKLQKTKQHNKRHPHVPPDAPPRPFLGGNLKPNPLNVVIQAKLPRLLDILSERHHLLTTRL